VAQIEELDCSADIFIALLSALTPLLLFTAPLLSPSHFATLMSAANENFGSGRSIKSCRPSEFPDSVNRNLNNKWEARSPIFLFGFIFLEYLTLLNCYYNWLFTPSEQVSLTLNSHTELTPTNFDMYITRNRFFLLWITFKWIVLSFTLNCSFLRIRIHQKYFHNWSFTNKLLRSFYPKIIEFNL